MGKHTAVEVGGAVVAAQVRDEDKAEFYASDIWDHEYCGPGEEACNEKCPMNY